MGKTFNTINIKHDINSFKADTLTNSGSFINPTGGSFVNDDNFFAGKNSGDYNSFAKKGAFYADLTSILSSEDLFQGEGGDTTNYSAQAMAFVPYIIFNQSTTETTPELSLLSAMNGNIPAFSGASFTNRLSTLLPFNVKVEGLIFDNRAKAIENAAYTFSTNVPLQSTNNTTSTNQIPLPSIVEADQCEITLTSLVNGVVSILPPPPIGQSPYTYNFVPGNIVEVRKIDNFNNITNTGFNATVTSFNQNTREITFTTIDGTVTGEWGSANRWAVTNQTNNDSTYIVNNALDQIVHFEMQFASYPINYSQTNVYPSPPPYPYLGFATSGNPTQFSGDDGEYISQVTYRKFWSPSIQDINNPNGISQYGNLFNHVFSVDSNGGSKINAFNLNLDNKQTSEPGLSDSAAYSLSGAFRRGGHVIVRGAYNIY